MADFNEPEKTQLYESVLSSIRALFASVVGLLDSRDTDPDNKPVRAKRWDDANARFQSWESSAWLTKLLGVAGGGTGASTASGARTSLGVPSTTDLTNHTGATSVHSATSAATASRLVIRDANGRAKMAAPSAPDDVAILSTVTGVFGAVVERAGTLTALRALAIPADGYPVLVLGRSEAGDDGGGIFVWSSANLASQVASDTLSGVFVASNSDSTGANGAWIRQYNGVLYAPWFGINGGGTDQATAFNAMFTDFPGAKFRLKPNTTYRIDAGVVLKGHGVKLEGNNATLDYYGTFAAVSFGLVGGTTYPVEVGIRQLNLIINSGEGPTGVQIRTSYSQFEEVSILLRAAAASAKGFLLAGDEENGSGPYYNMFLRCSVQSASAAEDHVGVFFSSVAPLYRGPNANTWVGGRVGQCATAVRIVGSGNSFYGLTIESVGNVGTAYHFANTSATGTVSNTVLGGYIENGNIGLLFDSLAIGNVVSSLYTTGLATTISDSGTFNEVRTPGSPWKVPSGVKFGSTSAAQSVLNYYEEGEWTPSIVGGTTAGDYGVGTTLAKYTRIGRMVTVSARLIVAINSAGTGAIRIQGLPFAKAASSILTGVITTSNVTLAANVIGVTAQQWTTSADSSFALAGVRSAAAPYDVLVTDLAAGSIIYLTVTYFA